MANKIDVHTHAIPDFYKHHIEALAHTGWPQFPWQPDDTRNMDAKLGVSTSILSLSAPGPEIIEDRDGAQACARQYNEWAAALVKAEPLQFGFFAAVPNLHDTEGCLAEIKYALDVLGADGVCLFTQYDGKYLGEMCFEPIWKELDARSAVVFIHPTLPKDYHSVSPELKNPAQIDFPHETGRTAATLVLTGMKRRYSNAKIILSHGGGTFPGLSERMAISQAHLFKHQIPDAAPKTAEEMMEDAKSFYFDLALAGTSNILDSLTRWAPEDRIMFGSDFPYCTVEAEYNKDKLEEYQMASERREAIYWKNALKLFPRLRQFYSSS